MNARMQISMNVLSIPHASTNQAATIANVHQDLNQQATKTVESKPDVKVRSTIHWKRL